MVTWFEFDRSRMYQESRLYTSRFYTSRFYTSYVTSQSIIHNMHHNIFCFLTDYYILFYGFIEIFLRFCCCKSRNLHSLEIHSLLRKFSISFFLERIPNILLITFWQNNAILRVPFLCPFLWRLYDLWHSVFDAMSMNLFIAFS
jgi:hypothetical protein